MSCGWIYERVGKYYDMKSDVMEWMINTQLGRRNLPPQQRIAVVKKIEK